ncbi:hypothetical protein PInf_000266 [Phytophthora infestans]|nr:hypothetical protein PInf_000266 [Phytophthora infestans]
MASTKTQTKSRSSRMRRIKTRTSPRIGKFQGATQKEKEQRDEQDDDGEDDAGALQGDTHGETGEESAAGSAAGTRNIPGEAVPPQSDAMIMAAAIDELRAMVQNLQSAPHDVEHGDEHEERRHGRRGETEACDVTEADKIRTIISVTVYGWQKDWLFWTSVSDSLYRSTKAKEKGSWNGMSFQNWNDPIEDEELRLARILAEADEEPVADAPATEGEGDEAEPRTQGETGEAAEGQAERAAGGHEERVDLDEDEGLFGTSPRAEENRRMFVTMLGTPQGRASFQEFFRTLADRPTPREEQARARETRETDTTSSGTRRGVSFSLDPSRPSLDPVEETSREATPAASTEYSRGEDPRRGYGNDAPASWSNVRSTANSRAEQQSDVERYGAPRATSRAYTPTASRGTTSASYGTAPASRGTTPTSAGTASASDGTKSVSGGTTTVDPALQALIVNTIGQAMQQIAVSSGSVGTPRIPLADQEPRMANTPPVYSSAEMDRLLESPRSEMRSPGGGRAVYQSPTAPRTSRPMSPVYAYDNVSAPTPRTNDGGGTYGTSRTNSFRNPFAPMLPPGWDPIEMPPMYPPTPVTTPSVSAEMRSEGVPNWGTKPANVGSFPNYSENLGLHENVGLNPERYPRTATSHPDKPADLYAERESRDYSRGHVPVVGIPNELRNAVKVIVPFYSDTATSERAAAFWRSFEKCTVGMDDQMRLTAFKQCVKGKKGQEWWYNSRIDSFELLRSRFHNRFICLTPTQSWARLKTAARKRGESAEEWGDRLSTICDAFNMPDPRMRYEFFLEGIRNKQMRAVLNGNMIGSIEQACRILLFKNLHLPVEEDDEFPEEGAKQSSTKNAPATDKCYKSCNN